jgi:hypothetical protein
VGGNSAACSTRIEVVDTLAPNIAIAGADAVDVECGLESYIELGALASDACEGDLSGAVVTTGGVEPAAPGLYEVTYSVSDLGNRVAVASRAVEVLDRAPPSIAAPAPIRVTASETSNAAIASFLESASASDACDPAPAVANDAPAAFPIGATPVTFTASDASGNTTAVTVVVTVEAPDEFCATVRRGTFGSVADTFIESFQPNGAGGWAQHLASSRWSAGDSYALLRFDLGFIPAGAQVTSASLALGATAVGGGPWTVQVHPVTGAWNEHTVTWDSVPTFGPAAASFSSASALIDVRALAQSWLAGGNHGLLLEQNIGKTNYVSSESTSVNERPALTICYSP